MGKMKTITKGGVTIPIMSKKEVKQMTDKWRDELFPDVRNKPLNPNKSIKDVRSEEGEKKKYDHFHPEGAPMLSCPHCLKAEMKRIKKERVQSQPTPEVEKCPKCQSWGCEKCNQTGYNPTPDQWEEEWEKLILNAPAHMGYGFGWGYYWTNPLLLKEKIRSLLSKQLSQARKEEREKIYHKLITMDGSGWSKEKRDLLDFLDNL